MDRFRDRRDGIRQIIGRSPLLRRGTVKLAAARTRSYLAEGGGAGKDEIRPTRLVN